MNLGAIFVRPFQFAALPESVQSLTERERKPGWAARRKPQTGLTVRLRPGEAFARSKSARVCAFRAHGQTLDRPAGTHPCRLTTPDSGQMDMAARRR